MTQGVKLDSPENEYRQCVFSCAIDLWACYAHGYLSGRFLAGGSTKYTTTVRHEDLVAYPTKIIDALIEQKLKRKRVGEGYPKVAPSDSYVGGRRGSKSSRGKALTTITRGRYTDPSELRQWVVQQTQRRSTLVGLLGYIPYAYAFMNNRPWSGSSVTLTHWRMVLSHLPLPLPVGAMRPQAGVVPLVGAMLPHAGQTLSNGFNLQVPPISLLSVMFVFSMLSVTRMKWTHLTTRSLSDVKLCLGK